MKKKIYSHKVKQAIESQIPKSIIEALNQNGWNVFGIYELVKHELKKEKENE